MTEKQRAMTVLLPAVERALRPRERPPMDEWADLHRVVAAGTSPMAGPWSTDNTPYLREPMRALSNPHIRRLTMMCGSQIGKTELINNWVLWCVDCDPAPMILVWPNAELAKDMIAMRIKPAVLASNRLKDRLQHIGPDGEAKGSNLLAQKMTFTGMPVWGVGSNSQTNLEGRSVRRLGMDEVDAGEFADTAQMYAEQRLKGFFRTQMVLTSKPSLENRGIHKEFLQGDQRRYWCPCIRCGCYQTWEFAKLRWEGGREADKQRVLQDAFMECKGCSRPMRNEEKLRMLMGGRWAPDGQRVVDGELVGEAKFPNPTHWSGQIGSLYSVVLPFGYVGMKFLEAGGATRGWVNGELGEPWREKSQRVNDTTLRKLCGGYKVINGDHDRKIPPSVACLTAFVDLQRDRAYILIVGHTAQMVEHVVVWWRCVKSDDRNPLACLDFLPGLKLPHADGGTMGISAGAVDSGDPQRTYLAYRWVMKSSGWYASKGIAGGGLGRPFDRKDLPWEDPKATDSQVEAGLNRGVTRFLGINTDVWKGHVFDRLGRSDEDLRPTADKETGEAPELETLMAGRIRFPEWEDDGNGRDRNGLHEVLKQVGSEELVTEKIKSGAMEGRERQRYMPRPGFPDNHFFDCLVGACALAAAIGVEGLTEANALRRRALEHINNTDQEHDHGQGQQRHTSGRSEELEGFLKRE